MLAALELARGLGVECAGRPGVWVPGAVEPAARTLPLARVERVRVPKGILTFLPDWVEDRGQFGIFTDPLTTAVELPADKDAKDALGRMVGSLPGMIAGKDWADVSWRNGQYHIDIQWTAAVLFQNLRAWGAELPQDTQLQDDAGMPWAGWPDGQSHTTRLVYAWSVGPSPQYALTQMMQVQKWYQRSSKEDANPFSSLKDKDSQFLVFNQWGQDLTFGRGSKSDNFSAGFDLGTWVTQHQCDLGGGLFTAFNTVYTAICTMVSFGAYGAETAATLAVGQAVQKLSQGVAQAATVGDWSAVFAGLAQIAAALGGIPLESGGTLGGKAAEAFLEQNKWVIDNPITKGVMSLIPSSGSTQLTELIGKAVAYGQQIKQQVTLTEQSFNDFKRQITSYTDLFYTQKGWDTGKTGGPVLEARASVPWYATGAFDMGAAAGTLMLVQQGGTPAPLAHKAARLRSVMPPAVGLPGSSTTKWVVGGLAVAGAATAAAIYTAPGRAAARAVGRTLSKAVHAPAKLQVAGGLAAVSILAAIWALSRKKSELLPVAETVARAPAPVDTVQSSLVAMRKT